jgi:putative DNA primase/helicase
MDTEEWRAETDLILAFARDRLQFDPAEMVLSSDLFLAFSAWLSQRGHKPWSDQTFVARFGSHDEIVRRGVAKGRRRSPKVTTEGGQTRIVRGQPHVWLGIGFGAPGDPHDNSTEPALPGVRQ